ncbi:DUF4931 domain-containing protein [Thermodesulfobacteriota bacterium]
MVENRFAALERDNVDVPVDAALFDELTASGAHEVIIESPVHEARFAQFSERKIQNILNVFQKRISDLLEDPGLRFIQIVRNCGPEAGASLLHPHTQLIGLPFVPDWIEREYRELLEYQRRHGHDFMQEQIEQARSEPSRIICENQNYIAFTLFAPRFPFESWILPMQPEHDYCRVDQERMADLAEILLKVHWAIDQTLDAPAYNFTLHTIPSLDHNVFGGFGFEQFYRWRFEIAPRLTTLSAFELGAGVFINPISPEKAASRLRQCIERGTRQPRPINT